MVEEAERKWWLSTAFVFPCAFCLLVEGIFFALLTSFAGPSLGYLVCSILFSASAFVWFRPRLGAAFSIPLCLVLLLQIVALQVWRWPADRGAAVAMFLAVPLSLVPCAVIVFKEGLAWKPLLVSTCLVLVSFAVDRMFTNKVEIRSLQMAWRDDGKTPWGEDAQLGSNGQSPVLIYVQSGEGYCYDAIIYEPLRQRLRQLGRPLISVQYNVFKDFGKERSYNVRSIEGFQFNDDTHTLIQDAEGYGGTSLVPLGNSRSYGPPVCPR